MQIHPSFKYGFYIAFKSNPAMYAPSLFILCTHSQDEVEKALRQVHASIEGDVSEVKYKPKQECFLTSLPDSVHIYDSDDVLLRAEDYMEAVGTVIRDMNYQIVSATSAHHIYIED